MTAETPSTGALPPRPPRFYVPQLDGLRFVAFIVVFYRHFLEVTRTPKGPWLQASIDAGALSVDLFFVLSSFLITSLLLRERAYRGTIDVRAFWGRRILRIWPLYFAFAALAVAFEQPPAWYTIGLLTFTLNWQLLHGWHWSVTTPLWSVSIEEQFYLTWPVISRFVSTSVLPWLCGGLICVSVAVRGVLAMSPSDPLAPTIWLNTFARLDPIAVGAILAWMWSRNAWKVSRKCLRATPALATAAVALVVLQRLWPFFGAKTGHEPWTYLAAALVLGGLVVSVLGSSPAGWLASQPLTYLGRISYGLYVFHRAAIGAMGYLPLGGLARLPVALALTLGLAVVSYHLLETPFLRLKNRLTYVDSAPVG